MRQLLLVALISSLAPSAFAQAHDLSSPEGLIVEAKHPAQVTPATSVAPPAVAKTELQKEAERVAVYRNARGLDNPTPSPVLTPTPLHTQSVQAPAAPNGLQPMELYDTPATGAVHTVVKKDTLYNISKRYGVTVVELKQANQLSGSAIQLGQTLLIPVQKLVVATNTPNLRTVTQPVTIELETETDTTLAADPVQRRIMAYAVLSGDTLAAIARRTCVSEDRLISGNALTNPDVLNPGHMLALPADHCLAQ
jgi:LysM repeat protein